MMLLQHILNTGIAPQEFAIPGAMDGQLLIRIAFSSAPSAGSATIETRRLGYESWDVVAAGVDLTAHPEALDAFAFGVINGVRVTFAGLAGPSAVTAWVQDVPLPSFGSVIELGASRDLSAGDAGNYLNATSAAPITLTVPPDAGLPWPTFGEVHLRVSGAGGVTLLEGSGVTIDPPLLGSLIVSQGMTVTLKRVSANHWHLIGQTVPA